MSVTEKQRTGSPDMVGPARQVAAKLRPGGGGSAWPCEKNNDNSKCRGPEVGGAWRWGAAAAGTRRAQGRQAGDKGMVWAYMVNVLITLDHCFKNVSISLMYQLHIVPQVAHC